MAFDLDARPSDPARCNPLKSTDDCQQIARTMFEASFEAHHVNCADQFLSSLRRLVDKQQEHAAHFQEQMSLQFQRRDSHDKRLERIEKVLVQQGQSINTMVEHLRRYEPTEVGPCLPDAFERLKARINKVEEFLSNGKHLEDNICMQYDGAGEVEGQQNGLANWVPWPSQALMGQATQATFPAAGTTPQEEPYAASDMITHVNDSTYSHEQPVDDEAFFMSFEDTISIAASSDFRADCSDDLTIGVDDVCNLMLKNIPCRLTKHCLLAVIDDLGFGKDINFFHVPARRGSQSNMGYAFIGFEHKDAAARFAVTMEGFRFSGYRSSKSCAVAPARIQGLKNNLEFCRKKKGSDNLPMLSV